MPMTVTFMVLAACPATTTMMIGVVVVMKGMMMTVMLMQMQMLLQLLPGARTKMDMAVKRKHHGIWNLMLLMILQINRRPRTNN